MKRPAILEIGDASLFKRALPEQTVLLWNGDRPPAGLAHHRWRAVDLPGWLRRLRRAEFDVLVVHARQRAAGRPPAAWRQRLGRLARAAQRGGRDLAGDLLYRAAGVPMVFVDFSDQPRLARRDLVALEHCRAAFKRELPLTAEHLLRAAPDGDAARCGGAGRERRSRWLATIQPISLGLSAARSANVAQGEMEKTSDIFWAGSLSNDLRRRGLEHLRHLRREGYRVDIAEAPLPHDEFMRRCARAWLVWSPQGYGWDCFRHYEAAAAGSVGVSNAPTIQRYQPLVAGEHCFHYASEGDDLPRVVRHALSDRGRLRAMAHAARAHVLRHHTHAALAAHILAAALDPTTFALSPAAAPDDRPGNARRAPR